MRSFRLSIAGAALAVSSLLVGCDAADPSADLTLAGTVTNSYGRPVAAATVSFDARDEDDPTYVTATTGADGRYSLAVPPGSYTIVTAADGYNPTGRTYTTGTDDDGALTQTLTGAGSLVAQVLSALTGQGAPDVVLQCVRRAADGSYPDIATAYDVSVTSSEDGTLSAAGIPAGPLRCRAEGPSFDPRVFDLTVRRDGPTSVPPLVVTPPPPEGALRIVLTWGVAPSDLDSHLTGPDGNGGRFHVLWTEHTFGATLLDVDDVTSYGPETITVYPQAEGTYRYSVHNWSDQSAGGSQGIASSPARVEVHDHLGLACVYEAPQSVQSGNTWRVFETGTRTAGGALAMELPCSRGASDLPGLGYVFAADHMDLGTFLTNPPPKDAGR